MMDVAHVSVRVSEGLVFVEMRMGLTGRRIGGMDVLVVLVMGVEVLMYQPLVDVPVCVAFGGHKDDAKRHRQSGTDLQYAEVLGKDHHGEDRTDERRGGEDNRFARRAQQAERIRVEHDAGTVRDGAKRQS